MNIAVNAYKRILFNPARILVQPAKLIYQPPPNSDVVLVREDAVLKSIVLHDKSYPIKLGRLEEIANSPTGWVHRMVPPPKLSFNIKRNERNRFDIDIHRKPRGRLVYTVLRNIDGNIQDLEGCLRWRLGPGYYVVNERTRVIVVAGFHKRPISTLLQALGF